MRRKVAVAAGGGMSHEEIAIALGVSRPTLEKYFEHELSVGAQQKRMAVLLAMEKAAKKGSVAAARFYTQNPIRIASEEGDEPLPPPVGKKAQANADAKTADEGTEWERLLRPKASTIQ